LLAAKIEGECGYAHGDARGSVVAITNASGDVVGNWRVDPWGRSQASEGNESGLGSQRHVFGGHVNDAATGLIYMRARFYDPETGLFLTQDPATGSSADPRSRHPYLYAHSSPLNGIDPSGCSTVFIGQHASGTFSDSGIGNPAGYNPIPTHWTEEIADMRRGLREAMASAYDHEYEKEFIRDSEFGQQVVADAMVIVQPFMTLVNVVRDPIGSAVNAVHDAMTKWFGDEVPAGPSQGLSRLDRALAAGNPMQGYMQNAAQQFFNSAGSAMLGGAASSLTKLAGRGLGLASLSRASNRAGREMAGAARYAKSLPSKARTSVARTNKAMGMGGKKSVGALAGRKFHDPFSRARRNVPKRSGLSAAKTPRRTGSPSGAKLKGNARKKGTRGPGRYNKKGKKKPKNDVSKKSDDERPKDEESESCNIASRGCFAAGTLVLLASGEAPIEQIDLGERVITDARQLSEDEAERSLVACPSEVDASWKRLTLLLDGSADGEDFITETLKSPEWMASNHAQLGGLVWIDLEDIGIRGYARVLGIEDAPKVEEGPGCVVLSRFTRANDNLIEVRLASGDVLELTDTHRLYSASRDQWIAAGALWDGEYLRGAFATVPVIDVRVVEGSRQVFNLEVEGEHRYLVGDARVLAHNTGNKVEDGCPKGSRTGATESGKWKFDPVKNAHADTHDEALQDAFRRTGVPKEEFEVTQFGKTIDGKSIPVEWQVKKGPNKGAQVNMDDPKIVPTQEGPQAPHVGYQMPGKRRDGGAMRGHIFPKGGVPASRGRLQDKK
jgi:RHS repeat-associated protein